MFDALLAGTEKFKCVGTNTGHPCKLLAGAATKNKFEETIVRAGVLRNLHILSIGQVTVPFGAKRENRRIGRKSNGVRERRRMSASARAVPFAPSTCIRLRPSAQVTLT